MKLLYFLKKSLFSLFSIQIYLPLESIKLVNIFDPLKEPGSSFRVCSRFPGSIRHHESMNGSSGGVSQKKRMTNLRKTTDGR